MYRSRYRNVPLPSPEVLTHRYLPPIPSGSAAENNTMAGNSGNSLKIYIFKNKKPSGRDYNYIIRLEKNVVVLIHFVRWHYFFMPIRRGNGSNLVLK